MKVLAVNVPNIKYIDGQIYTGPHNGSRWPFVLPGPSFHSYAPYPFNQAYAVNYLRYHGITADLYDGVAECHANPDQVRQAILDYRPSIVLFEVLTPVFDLTNEIAAWTKATIESKIVFYGQHVRAFAQACKDLPHVDHCIIGEPELSILDIVQRYPGGDGIYENRNLPQVDTLPDGSNFLPYRNYSKLGQYYDPSMQTARTQLQMNTSRVCPYACTFCESSRFSQGASYRARSAELVIDEIQQCKDQLGNSLGSIFFDDNIWGIGPKRVEAMCKGLKALGLPWTMMTRADTLPLASYDNIVDSGCVGMRLGIESFQQRLLDNIKKNMSAQQLYDTLKYLVTRYSGLEFHFTSMSGFPGSQDDDRKRDEAIISELIQLGGDHGNRVHCQHSKVTPLPSTELWHELIELGHGDKLSDFNMYDGAPNNTETLIKATGLLGNNYKPKTSRWSGDGAPTQVPA